MCNHCRIHVEKALNSMEGVHATVTLNPPVAAVEFSEGEKTLDELQAVVTARRRLHVERITGICLYRLALFFYLCR